MNRGYKLLITALTALIFPVLGWAEITEVIAINFGSDKAAVSSSDELLGYVSEDGARGAQVEASKWNNVSGGSTTDTEITVSGTSGESYALTYKAAGTWNADTGTDTEIGRLTKGYLDVSNHSSDKPVLTLTGMPTTGYDVAVILSGDGGTYGGVTVNGTTYIGDTTNRTTIVGNAAWGTRTGNTTTLAEGTNVIYVPCQRETELSIVGLATTKTARSSIAGLMVFFRNDSVATVSGEPQSSNISWSQSLSTDRDAVLFASADSTVEMDDSIEAKSLTTFGSKITFTAPEGDAGSLNVRSATINADTDVTGITADLGAVTIASGKTLSIGDNTSLSVANGANSGTIHVTGGTAAAPVVLNCGTAANDYIGKIAVAADTYLRLHATGGNKAYNVTGNGASSHVILTSGADWGVSNNANSKFNNCVLEIPESVTGTTANKNFWLTPSKVGSDVHFVLNRQLTFENDNNAGTLNIASLSGEGNIVANGSHTIKITNGAGKNYSGVISGTHSVVKEGAGEQIFSAANTYSGTTTISGGTLKVASNGSLGTGAVTVNADGTLTYAADATPANTFAGSGTITADACTLDLTSATISSYIGTYATANEGKIILPAGAETVENIAANSSIVLKLSAAQMVSGYTATVPEGVTVVFYDNTGALIEGNAVSGNAYTPARKIWTKGSDGNWATEGNWSNESLPGESDSVCISITEDTMITLTSAVTVANLEVKGSGTLTIAGAKLTVSSMMVANTSVVAGENLLAFTDLAIADDKTVTINNTEEFIPGFIAGGTFVKNGSGALKFLGDGAPVVDGTTLNIAAGSLVANGSNGGGTADTWLKDTTLIFGEGVMMSASNWVLATGTTTLKSDYAFSYTTRPFYSNESTLNFVVGGTGSVTFWNERGKAVEVLANATYCTSTTNTAEVISGAGKVKMLASRAVTTDNTYTGGTEIASGVTVTVATLEKLGTKGTIQVDGVLKLANTANYTVATANNARLTGSGSLEMAATGNFWTCFQNGFTTTLDLITKTSTNNQYDIIAGQTPDSVITFGSLSGDGEFRCDWGDTGTRTIVVEQDADTTFSGTLSSHDGGSGKQRTLNLTVKGKDGKSLTFAGSTNDALVNTLTVDSTGSVNLTSTWQNNVVNNGVLGGTGTIGGTLTLADGATIDVSAGAITVTDDVTFPIGGAITVTGITAPTDGEVKVLSKDYDTDGEIVVEGVAVTIGDSADYYLVQKSDGLYVKTKAAVDSLTVTLPAGTTNVSISEIEDIDLTTQKLANLTIAFTKAGQTFTFDDTHALMFESITVTGEAGKILFAENSAAVTTPVLTVQTSVDVAAGKLVAKAATVDADSVLTVNDSTTVPLTLNTVTGKGTLKIKNAEFTRASVSDTEVTLDISDGSVLTMTSGGATSAINKTLRGSGSGKIVFSVENVIGWDATKCLTTLDPVVSLDDDAELEISAAQVLHYNIAMAGNSKLSYTNTNASTDKNFKFGEFGKITVLSGTPTVSASVRSLTWHTDKVGHTYFDIADGATLTCNADIVALASDKITVTGKIAFVKTTTFAGVISGTGSVTVEGGTLTLTAANAYTGGTTINAGAKLVVNGAGTSTQVLPTTKTVTNNGIVELQQGHSLTVTIEGEGTTLVSGTYLFEYPGETDVTNGINTSLTVNEGATLQLKPWGKANNKVITNTVKNLTVNGTIEQNEGKVYSCGFAVSGTLSGTGTINSPFFVTLANGATVDATAGTLTVAGTVNWPTADGAKVNFKLGSVVTTATSIPLMKITKDDYTFDDANIAKIKIFLGTTDITECLAADGRVYFNADTETLYARTGTEPNGTTGPIWAALEAATVKETSKVLPISGIALTGDAELDAVAVFDGVTTPTVTGEGENATVSFTVADYNFGISGITAAVEDGTTYVIITATVEGIDTEATVNYAEGANVNLYKGGKVLIGVTDLDATEAKAYGLIDAEATAIPAGVKYLKVPYANLFTTTTPTSSETAGLTVKVSKEAQQAQ